MQNFKNFIDDSQLDTITEEEILQAKVLIEKNVPTSPEKWAKAKAAAKSKFSVYPSAYANGWAAKKYKAMGGGWKSVSEAANPAQQAAIAIAMKKAGKKPKSMKEAKDPHEYGYEGEMALNQLKTLVRCAEMIEDMLKPDTDLPEWVQSKITLATDYIQTAADYLYSEMKEEYTADEMFDLIEQMVAEMSSEYGIDSEIIWEQLEDFTDEELVETCSCWPGYKRKPGTKPCATGSCVKEESDLEEDAKGYKNPTGGLTQKGRDYYNHKFGGHLKAPVTTPPSKLKPGSKAANRRKSFCARMSGVQGPMKKPNGEPTRKALALRKWNC